MWKKIKTSFENQVANVVAGVILYVPLILFFFWLGKNFSEDPLVQIKHIIGYTFVCLMIQGMCKTK